MQEFRHWGCAQGLADVQYRRKKTVFAQGLADLQFRRKKTVYCTRPLQICKTGGRRWWFIRPNPVGWKFLGAFLKYIINTASSEDGSCLENVVKKKFYV